ncbi:Lon Peptidase N-Terminal Domain And Ring Finger Protein 3 [Manis pentadactyla]|nr:Lon Peptidase N-Terminal Domain And Ring Finger Protein 3 [Manis pentadactyla]
MLMVAETLALRKELGSGSDVTGGKMLDQGYGRAAMVTSVFQANVRFSSTIVLSKCGIHGDLSLCQVPQLTLGLCNRKRVRGLRGYGSILLDPTRCEKDGQIDLDHRDIGDINADAGGPGLRDLG